MNNEEQIEELIAAIRRLEARIAALESRPVYTPYIPPMLPYYPPPLYPWITYWGGTPGSTGVASNRTEVTGK